MDPELIVITMIPISIMQFGVDIHLQMNLAPIPR